MKKMILPLAIFVLGMFIADYFFRIDVLELFRGFFNFLINLFKGGSR